MSPFKPRTSRLSKVKNFLSLIKSYTMMKNCWQCYLCRHFIWYYWFFPQQILYFFPLPQAHKSKKNYCLFFTFVNLCYRHNLAWDKEHLKSIIIYYAKNLGLCFHSPFIRWLFGRCAKSCISFDHFQVCGWHYCPLQITYLYCTFIIQLLFTFV